MSPAAVPAVPRRRNVAVLTLAQALFMSVQGMAIATTPLAGYMLLGADEKWLATLPIFLAHLGIMGTTIPASLLMAAIGRRAGFSLGALLGVAFGAVGCLALYRQSFPLLCLAALLQGMQAAFFWYFRLAAADATEPAFRAKAISLVMAGGVAAGFIGPQAAKWAVDWLAPVTFAGVYVGMAGFSIAVLLLVQLLAYPEAERRRARRRRPAAAGDPAPAGLSRGAGLLGVRLRGDDAHHVGHAARHAGLRLHVPRQRHRDPDAHHRHVPAVVLHRPSHCALRRAHHHRRRRRDRVRRGRRQPGRHRLCQLRRSPTSWWGSAGTSPTWADRRLLTTTYAPAERAKVQASHDFTVYTATATSAALSGVLQAKAGWIVINLAAVPLMVVVVGAALWLMAQQRRVAVAPAE